MLQLVVRQHRTLQLWRMLTATAHRQELSLRLPRDQRGGANNPYSAPECLGSRSLSSNALPGAVPATTSYQVLSASFASIYTNTHPLTTPIAALFLALRDSKPVDNW